LSVGTGSGSGLVNINSNGTLYFGNTTVGSVTGAGALVQNSGTVNLYPSGNYVNIGSNGYGSYTLAGGTLNTPSSTGIKVGFGGPAVYTQTAGALVDSRYFIVGTQSNSGSGVATFTGGTAAITNRSYEIIIGDGAAAAGVLNVGTEAGGSALIATGSSPLGVQVTDNLEISGNATLNLNPGTINIQGGAIKKGGSAGSTATVNLNGVTLQAGLLGSLLIDNTLNSVNVYNGGLIVDTQGNNTTISANLSGTNGDGIYVNNGNGTLAVSSTNGGSLTLSGVNMYSGPTNVSGGSVVLAAAGALPSGTNLTIAAGASVVANNLGSPIALSVGSLAVAGKLDLKQQQPGRPQQHVGRGDLPGAERLQQRRMEWECRNCQFHRRQQRHRIDRAGGDHQRQRQRSTPLRHRWNHQQHL
jgi:autotransporter-associated beta strand protein